MRSGRCWFYLRLAAPVLAGSALVSGCDVPEVESASWSEATGSPEVPVTATVALAEFEGYANPSTGEFSVQVVRTFDPHVQLQAIYEGHGLRTIGQAEFLEGPGGPAAEPAPWCVGRVVNDGTPGTNPVDTFELYTDPATIAASTLDPDGNIVVPSVCRQDGADETWYPIDGVFCATVRAMNFNTVGWSEVHAQLYRFDGVGSENFLPYALGLGTSVLTTDALGETLPQYADLPDPGGDLALWRYGNLASGGGSGTQVWTFRNMLNSGGFNFRGRVIGQVAENCDTPDINEDCDPLGRGDNGCFVYAAGTECTANSDCLSAVCFEGFCADGCAPGRWGPSCENECAGGAANPCSGNGACNDGNGPGADGTCTCAPNFYGADCSVECAADETWTEATGCVPRECQPGTLDFYGDGSACVEVEQVSAGISHTCAVMSDGTLWCWGRNANGQLGDGTLVNRLFPVQVGEWSDWTSVSAANTHTCGTRGLGELYCWGLGEDGQLGNGLSGSSASRSSPTRVGTAGNWTLVSAGINHTCGLRGSALYCWGSDNAGQLGNNTAYANSLSPVQVAGSWRTVAVGYYLSCGIRTDNQAYCWGSNAAGGLGNNSSRSTWVACGECGTWSSPRTRYCERYVTAPTPVLVHGGHMWEALDVTQFTVCGVRTDSTKMCWGEYGSTTTTWPGGSSCAASAIYYYGAQRTPVDIPSAAGWSSVVAGYGSACGLEADGALLCHGAGGSATMGLSGLSPQREPTLARWTSVTMADSHGCGVREDGSLHCWGWNGSGQLGDGSTLQSSVPIPSLASPD